ncbi:MAG: methionine--tRNA ligase [Alphaproteobacteria bacterium]|nr:MAG: methionine--tRNA ligase [Alphaproteobacteria bacterium]
MVSQRRRIIRYSYTNYTKLDFGLLRTSKQFVTAPIFYVNGSPHLGHVYTAIATDILHRFCSLFGESFFSIGTDEHGQKIEQAAQSANCEVQQYVDNMYAPFHELMKLANVSYNKFIRTTSQEHKATVLEFWSKLEESGDLYEGIYQGWYSTRDEQFYKDDEIEDKKAKISGSPVELVEERCTFFRLSKYKDALLQYYRQHKNLIAPTGRYNEVIGMLESDLPDLAVTRSRFSWGIKIDANQVIYVWVDALTNYITAMGDNRDYWISDMVHIIGKDILKFHAIYWPALLMSARYPLPKRIYAHGWWTVNGEKMSKSVGNVLDASTLIKLYGVDQLRYCIMREMSFGQDGNFNHDRIAQRINSELVNAIGNLVHRVLKFVFNEFGQIYSIDDLTQEDVDILTCWDEALSESVSSMNNQQIHLYLDKFNHAIMKTNQYIDFQSPWKKDADDKKRILGIAMECIKRMAILMYPVMPNTSKAISEMLKFELQIGNWNRGLNQSALTMPEPLFKRFA